TLGALAEGKVLKGVVKNITGYGAFIDLGGIDGLLHITDMSWGRVGRPSELFKVNDEIVVIVLKYDPATERVSLGHKQLITDPWANVMERYPVGARMGGKVVSLTDYGAFIELEPGVEGLIHVSEMSWSKRVKHPSKILNVGDTVDAMVLGLDATARRISLGLKQVETNPWHDLAEKYPVGSKIQGKVRNLTEFGAFVEVEEEIDGLIHISDMSWSKRIKHPSEVLKKGDVVEAMVLNIDAENQRLSLGLKQLATDIWDDFFSRHHVGDTIEGKVVRMTNFGAFVELDEGIEGLIHVSEFDDSHRAGKDEKITLTVGESYPMKIIKLAPAELVEEVSRVSDLTKKHSEVIVDTVFRSIIEALHRGEKIELRGFGSFRLRKREPRKGRNPKTGDKVDVPPKKVPYFKPGKELKDLINREAELAEAAATAPAAASASPAPSAPPVASGAAV